MEDKATYEELEQKVRHLQNSLDKLQQSHFNSAEKELFRLAFENANIGMCLVDLKGNLFKVNAEMANIFGYSADELEKMNVNDIAHPDFTELSPHFIKDASEGILSRSIFEKKYIHRNGSLVTCIVTSSAVLDESGNTLFFISHVQDITDKKNTEILLIQQKEELQVLNSEKDRFFSIIAHDLMSPFTSIVGFSNLLEENVMNKDYNGIEEYSGIILQSSQRVLNLLQNLMGWARSRTGRIAFTPEQFDIVSLINEVESLYSDLARQKKIVISKNLPAWATLFADYNMISTVIRNLLSNAIKFTNTDGQITISLIQDQNDLIISIADSGIGICKESMKRLFHTDQSHSTPGTHDEKGTGLGLLLCKEFVEKHGGRIWVESESGKGSEFKFTLPLKGVKQPE